MWGIVSAVMFVGAIAAAICAISKDKPDLADAIKESLNGVKADVQTLTTTVTNKVATVEAQSETNKVAISAVSDEVKTLKEALARRDKDIAVDMVTIQKDADAAKQIAKTAEQIAHNALTRAEKMPDTINVRLLREKRHAKEAGGPDRHSGEPHSKRRGTPDGGAGAP